jgi:hypothetical protein
MGKSTQNMTIYDYSSGKAMNTQEMDKFILSRSRNNFLYFALFLKWHQLLLEVMKEGIFLAS